MNIIRIGILSALMIQVAVAGAQKAGKRDELGLVLPEVQFAAEKSAIRPDAARALDQVAVLLKKSPKLTLEVGAHTDASGSASYNLRLSQQRAQAVMGYLIKRGIAAKRLSAKGYGETQPLNRCRRGVRCSEAEKRENRRIEIRVQGLPQDSEARYPWLELIGQAPPKAAPVLVAKQPDDERPALNRLEPQTATAVTAPPANLSGDFFPELSEGRQYVAEPLSNTFIGYTVEIGCSEKPLAAGHPLLRKYDPVHLRYEAGGSYCYYIGAFTTLPAAQQFLQDTALALFPKAQIAAFWGDQKKYYPH